MGKFSGSKQQDYGGALNTFLLLLTAYQGQFVIHCLAANTCRSERYLVSEPAQEAPQVNILRH